MPEDQDPVQHDICKDRYDGGFKRNPDLTGTPEQGSHDHRAYHQRVGETHDTKVLDADLLNGCFIRIEPHDGIRKAHGKYPEEESYSHYTGHCQTVRPVDPVIVFSAEKLGKEQHAASHEAEVAAEQKRRKLGAESHGADLGLTEGGNHHCVNHGPRCGQQVLQSHRDGDHGYFFYKAAPGKRIVFLSHSALDISCCPEFFTVCGLLLYHFFREKANKIDPASYRTSLLLMYIIPKIT